MSRLFSYVDRLSAGMAYFAAFGIVALMITLLFEVFMRYIFGAPTSWSFDVSYYINSFVVITGAAYTLTRDSHVRVDLLYARLPERMRAAVNGLLMWLVFVPLWVLLLIAMWPNIASSWRTGERASLGTWQPPIYPFKTWIFLGLCLLLLQGVVAAYRDTEYAVKGRR